MHKIDTKITANYLDSIRFALTAAIEALSPNADIQKVGLSEFCHWSNTHEGHEFWHRRYNKGLDDKARVIISDMILVSMGMSVEEAAKFFNSGEKN